MTLPALPEHAIADSPLFGRDCACYRPNGRIGRYCRSCTGYIAGVQRPSAARSWAPSSVRVPEWRRRALTGEGRAVDLTGAVRS